MKRQTGALKKRSTLARAFGKEVDMNGLYAIVKRYETPEVEFADWVYRPDDHGSIYDRMMELTGSDHEISADFVGISDKIPTFYRMGAGVYNVRSTGGR